jgi:hypothetical protein
VCKRCRFYVLIHLKVDKNSEAAKRRKAKELKESFVEDSAAERQYFVHIKLPKTDEHTQHSLNKVIYLNCADRCKVVMTLLRRFNVQDRYNVTSCFGPTCMDFPLSKRI